MGNSNVTVDTNTDIYVRDTHLKDTRGFWELLSRKIVDNRLVSEFVLKQYKSSLDFTSAHLEGYEPVASNHISRRTKFRTIIAKLFPQIRRRRNEAPLREQWLMY